MIFEVEESWSRILRTFAASSSADSPNQPVDLNKAVEDPSERIRVIPGDLLILQYHPKELAGNVLLNLFDFGFTMNERVNFIR
jgi:hypothetical protein